MQAFSSDFDLGDEKLCNRKTRLLKEFSNVWKKKFFLKRIRIRQETDLKIPKALSNRVFENGYSKRPRGQS